MEINFTPDGEKLNTPTDHIELITVMLRLVQDSDSSYLLPLHPCHPE